MMVRLEQMYRVTDVTLNESAQESGRHRHNSSELRAPLQVRPHGQLQPGAARERGAQGRDTGSGVTRRWIVMSSMSDRDRKILLGVIPVVLIVAYWFLLLAPKRQEAIHGLRRADEAGGASRLGQGTRPTRPPRRRPTSAATTPRSCDSARRFRPTWTCPACSCSWRVPPRAPASASRGSPRASVSLPRLLRPPRRARPRAAGSGGARPRPPPAAARSERTRSGCRGRQQRRGPVRRGCRPPRPRPAKARLPVGGGAPDHCSR